MEYSSATVATPEEWALRRKAIEQHLSKLLNTSLDYYIEDRKNEIADFSVRKASNDVLSKAMGYNFRLEQSASQEYLKAVVFSSQEEKINLKRKIRKDVDSYEKVLKRNRLSLVLGNDPQFPGPLYKSGQNLVKKLKSNLDDDKAVTDEKPNPMKINPLSFKLKPID